MQEKSAQSGVSRHALLMIVCCAVPMLLLTAVVFFGVSLSALGSWAIVLLCPLLHVGMMYWMMRRKGGHSCHGAPASGQAETQAALPQQPPAVGARS